MIRPQPLKRIQVRPLPEIPRPPHGYAGLRPRSVAKQQTLASASGAQKKKKGGGRKQNGEHSRRPLRPRTRRQPPRKRVHGALVRRLPGHVRQQRRALVVDLRDERRDAREEAARLAVGVVVEARQGVGLWGEGQGRTAVGRGVVGVEDGNHRGGGGALDAGEDGIVVGGAGAAVEARGDVGEVRAGGVGAADGGVGQAGLRDDAVDERVGGVGVGVFVDRHAAVVGVSVCLEAGWAAGNLPGGLAEQDHAVGVATERVDVLVHPLDRFALVLEARVEVLSVESGGVWEAEDVDAVAGGW